MKKKITFVLLLFMVLLLQASEEEPLMLTSSYTSIDQKDCVTLDSDNMGSIQECEPFGEIGVKVIEGDIRQSIVLTRDMDEYNLDFTGVVSSLFSSLGLKIEWRHELGKPENVKGMIVRFEASDDYEKPDNTSSYLVVSKISKDEMCVVAIVAPQKNQNELARKVLESTKALPCLEKSNIP
ncbi:MAG TPA: hypothetical protein ENK82_08990 [Campylobacterales bacterium]|nr:hypothetical protein [Campylobacterales bacterium]